MDDREMYNRPGFNRRYVPKQCALCGSGDATLAIQVLCRSVGKGQGRETRVMKLSQTVKVCEGCAKRTKAITAALAAAAVTSLEHVQSERTLYGVRARR